MTFSLFILTMLAAVATNNLMFSFSLGTNKWFLRVRSFRRILVLGAIFTSASVVANTAYYGITLLLARYPTKHISYIRHFIMLFIIFIIFIAAYFFTVKVIPQHLRVLRIILPIALFNNALMATFHVVTNYFGDNNSLLNTILYSFGLGLGYTIAMVVVYFAKKRLILSPVPKSFKGTPIILLYIGIFSLGIFGLIGYGVSA